MKALRFFKVITGLLFLVTTTVNARPMVLWYSSDAGSSFTDALPIGNGYMGGLVYGGVSKDIIGLNEGTVWSGGPGDKTNRAPPIICNKHVRHFSQGTTPPQNQLSATT